MTTSHVLSIYLTHHRVVAIAMESAFSEPLREHHVGEIYLKTDYEL